MPSDLMISSRRRFGFAPDSVAPRILEMSTTRSSEAESIFRAISSFSSESRFPATSIPSSWAESRMRPPSSCASVADSSLRFDREVKGRLYAEAGIADYWIVNLVDDVLEVYRDPREGTYSTKLVCKAGDRIALLSFPDLDVAVRDLIP